MRLPGSIKERKEKLKRGINRNMHKGISSNYDVNGRNKEEKVKLDNPHYVIIERTSKVFAALEDA